MTPLLLLLSLLHYAAAKIPVLIDTDFGYAMDDVFAVAFALRQSAATFDIKLISTASLNTTKRAELLITFLSLVGYDDIDIAIGIESDCDSSVDYKIECVGPIWPWLDTVDQSVLASYSGNIYSDGIAKMESLIREHSASDPLYILELAPMDNVGAIFSTNPELRANVRFFTMSGEVSSTSTPYGHFAEWNVALNVTAAQTVYNDRDQYPFAGPMVDVPWDSGYWFYFDGDLYQQLVDSDNVMATTILDIYSIQYANGGYSFDLFDFGPDLATPSLFDLEITWISWVIATRELEQDTDFASILREDFDFIEVEGLEIAINDTGFVVDAPGSEPVFVLTEWIRNGIEAVGQIVVDAIIESEEQLHPMVIVDGDLDNVLEPGSRTSSQVTIDSMTLDYITMTAVCIMMLLLLVLWMRQRVDKGSASRYGYIRISNGL